MQTLAFVLDIVLVIAAIAVYLARPRIGGQLAGGFQALTIGLMMLGLAHLIETVLFGVFNIGTPLNEVIHRLLVTAGFAFVIVGFNRMRRAFNGAD